ncbi:MAG: LD-carboxypeptidase [Alphaproteobacteria bacterium]|nr:LD-carboxypeptidase [Alphaproteobacteria bacterium]
MTSRRQVLGGIGASAMLGALPREAGGSPPSARGRRLRPGDTVGLVCPAGFVGDRFGLEQVSETVRAMGLVPKAGKHLLTREGYLAGTDRQRADDLNAMFADDSVRAILAVRGGWGCQRVLPHLDFDLIAANPKLLVGSSDVTALLLANWGRTGLFGVHGPNASHSWPPAAWAAFRALAFDGATPTYSVPPWRGPGLAPRGDRVLTFGGGTATGRLLGGNLSVISAMVGTPWLPDIKGAILFLEETNEAEYRIDRMLAQLGQAGVLGALAGVVFGRCTNCRNPGTPYSNYTVYEVMDHHFKPLGVPAFSGLGFGHVSDTISLPVGAEVRIDADKGTLQVLEAAVA